MSAIHDDTISITNLLTDEKHLDLEYASRDLQTLLPLPFQGSSVQFDMQSITSSWVELHNGWLSVPITVTPQAATFSASHVIAFKGSILSMLRGVEVKTGAGQTILSEMNGSLPFISHLRMMLENNNDWTVGSAGALQFAKDRSPAGVPSGLHTKANIQNPRTAKYTGAPSGISNADSSICNLGFLERNAALLDSTFGLDGSYTANKSAGFSTVLNIPLSYISSFFAAMDFPIINTRLVFTFHFNTTASASPYQPLCMGTTQAGTVETGTAPVVALTAGAQPLLTYYRVSFPTALAEQVAKRAMSGFKKTLVFTQCDIVTQFSNIASTSNFQHSVGTAINAPKRVWAMAYPAGVVNGVTWPSPLVTGAETALTNVNVQINGTRYLQNDLSTLQDQYQALCSAMSPVGMDGQPNSMISFGDFVKSYRIVCLDISRSGNKQLDPNQPVSLLVTGNTTSATAADIIYLIEKEVRVVMQFGAGPLLVEVGPNAV